MDRFILERLDWDKVGGDNFEQVVVDRKDKARLRGGVDESQKISFAFLEDFLKDRQAFRGWYTSRLGRRITCPVSYNSCQYLKEWIE